MCAMIIGLEDFLQPKKMADFLLMAPPPHSSMDPGSDGNNNFDDKAPAGGPGMVLRPASVEPRKSSCPLDP